MYDYEYKEIIRHCDKVTCLLRNRLPQYMKRIKLHN